MSLESEYYAYKNRNKKKKKTQQNSGGSSLESEYFAAREELGLDDIAPVKKTTTTTTSKKPVAKQEEEEDEGFDFFQKGAFDDGYQFGDVTKSILGTVGDIGVGVVKGVSKLAGGVLDAGAYGVAGLADVAGNDDLAARLRKRAQQNVVDDFFVPMDEALDKNSLLGKTSDSIAEGLGQVGAVILTGGLAGAAGAGVIGATAATTGLMGVSSFGSGVSEAYMGGATDEEAATYGLIKGVVDAGSELIFGGLGKAVKAVGLSKGLSSLDDVFAQKLASKITSQTAKNFVEFGVKASAEGVEEVLAGIGSAVGKKLTYMEEKELRELVKDEKLLEQFVVGAVTSGISQSGLVPGMKSGSLVESIQTDRDFISSLSTNEQKVIDKVYEDRIAESEKDGKKLTKQEKSKIYDEVLNEMERGYISTDTIEEVLGGDTYKSYKDTIDSEDALSKEFEELGNKQNATLAEQSRYAELKQQIADMKQNSKREQLKSQLGQEVFGLVQSDRLAESYNERSRRGQAFEADLTKYDEKHKAVIQKAIDSGILNNTNRTHEFVDMIAKISADKGVLFDFTNNEKLKGSSFAVDGKTVNGFVTKDGVTLNIDSAKSLNSVVGHEITHVLEGTDLYDVLQKTIVDYAKSKGDYQGRYDALTELYKDIKDADVNAELTADLVGDYLFTDSDFIKNLSVNNRNVFQKIYDEVKYLCKVATAGSKEARELEKVKRAFEKAYKEGGEVADTKYSVSDKNIKDVSTGYASGETYFTMTYTQDGKVVGELNYGEYNGEANVKMIEVDPEYRRKGIGKKLLQELQKKYPDSEIDFGMSTPDGTKLIDAVTYTQTDEQVVEGKRKLRALQTELVDVERRLNELYDLEELTAEQEREMEQLGERWDELYYTEIRNAQEEYGDKPESKRFVKYSISDSETERYIAKSTKKYGDVEKAAIEHFGITDNFRTAGYILRDGQMLDFSGAHWLDGASDAYIADWKKKNDIRQVDHEDIFEAFEISADDFPSDSRKEFINRGNIRMSPEAPGINIAAEPTAEQYQAIRSLIKNNPYNADGFYVDIENKTKRIDKLSYSGKVNADRVINDIKYFYQNGKAREQSTISQFLSLSESGETPVKHGNYNVYGEDIALETAPTVSKTESVRDAAPVTVAEPMFPDDLAPMSEPVPGQFDSLTDADAPPEMEAPYYEDGESVTVDDPFENRDIDEVGNRKVKAYMYENPEVKPFFQAEAKVMLNELQNSVKGERLYNDELYYESGGEHGWMGTKRQTSDDIAYLLDTRGYTYKDIENGLNAIIEDNGAENNAVSKRIEFILNDRLKDGYMDFLTGYDVPANQDYINLLNEKQITEYSKEALEALLASGDEYAPPVEANAKTLTAEDIETLRRNATFMLHGDMVSADAENKFKSVVADLANNHADYSQVYNALYDSFSYFRPAYSERHIKKNFGKELSETAKYLAERIERGMLQESAPPISEEISEDIAPVSASRVETASISEPYEAIRPKREKHPRLARATPEEQTKIAEILDEEPTPRNRKSRVWARFKASVLDKGAVFEDLSLKHRNRELMGKWNYILSSESRAQRLMGNGANVVGVKSLNAIREEVGNTGKTKQFTEYLYHKHNVDRMSLAQRYADTPNKPVFGSTVTADVSQKVVDQYEANHPEFVSLANDVYNYMNYLRQQMVDNGLISQDTADLWAEMYPHYVPIRREGDEGLNVNVPLDTGRTGVNAPVKRATGGNRNILPLFDTMAMRTQQTYKAIAKNSFGVELKNTLGTTIANDATNLDEMIDSIDTQDGLLQEGKNGSNPTFTVFENGEKVTFEITEDMYDALKPVSGGLSTTIKPLNFASNFHRGLLTEYNPVFMLNNMVKDAQDILINSQHAAKTYAKVPEAFAQLVSKGYWYNEYMDNGGEQNTYFDNKTNTFKTENKGLSRVLDMPPFSTISALNNFIEMTPRLAEYIASREAGRSVEVSMLDAARVTTNFQAGGDLTKFLNRNGATFLNASVQGAMQNIRNFREAHANGVKGYVNLATKFAIAGLPAVLLNNLVWDDDEEYEELSDYVKQSYYIVGKYGDGKFIRIPKGRTLAVIQNAFEQVSNSLTGDDELDLATFLELAATNLAPNNPIENNILSPIAQVIGNKTWYGEDLVPTRLQDLPAAEQFDESTDSFSKWLGGKLDISPVKINYLLDQYSGGVGDVVLPMLTPEAESGDNTLFGNIMAPLKKKFTTDSVMNNQNVSDFYDTKDELTTNAKKSDATDEDVLMSKYFNSVNAELSELYKQKREIQSSDLPDDEKYEAVRDIQKQIVELTKDGLDSYPSVSISGGYAEVGDRHYRKNDDGEWTKLTDKQLEKQEEVTKGLGISASDYWSNKEEYDFAYEKPEKYAVAKSVGGYSAYMGYSSELNDIKGVDNNGDGRSDTGTRKANVIDWVNNLDADYGTKIILFKSEYNADDTYNYDIIEYLNSRQDISYEDMATILKELGFEVDSEGNISW